MTKPPLFLIEVWVTQVHSGQNSQHQTLTVCLPFTPEYCGQNGRWGEATRQKLWLGEGGRGRHHKGDVLGRRSEEKGFSMSFQETPSSISLLRTDPVIVKRETSLDDLGASVHTPAPILQSACVLVQLHACVPGPVQLSVTPKDCRPPSASVHGVLQARVLEWVAASSSRGSARSGD